MKPRTAQLGARKNPDSSRVHGLRLAANSSSTSHTQTRDSQAGGSFPPVLSVSEQLNPSPEDATNRTTEGDAREKDQLLTVQEVADLLRVRVSWVYGHTRKRSRERIPGYRVGKYWRFSADEVMSWLRESRQQSVPDRMA
ncbi:MAG: helix-turn-helix domain-containing protein [Candidatus Dormibacteria bacterium]